MKCLVASLLTVFCLVDLASAVQDPSTIPHIRGLNNSLGLREHRPGYWSYLNPEINNPTNSDADLEVVVFFASLQNRKFAKRVQVPARTTLRVTVPVRIPASATRGVEAQVQLYDVSGESPILLVNKGKRSYDTAIPLRDAAFGKSGEGYRATAMFEPADQRNQDKGDAAKDLVSASRIFFNHNGRIGTSTSMFLPESARAFESVDQIVIHNDHLLDDTAGLESVRRWLARGGSLWIMVDLVSEETIRRILGDKIPFQLIDRTSLNRVQIKDADQNSQVAPPQPRFFEKPVDFARVVLTEGNLIQTQDDWPASFWTKISGGKVFFTTLGARAWMRERRASDGEIDNRLGITSYTVTEPMELIGFQMYAEDKPAPVFDLEGLKTNLVNQVGYSVLSRGSVLAILSTYAILLFAIGLWLAKRQQLDRLFYVGPVLAIGTALVFYAMGLTNQKSAEPTVAAFQFVERIAGSDEFQADGTAVLFSHQNLDFELGATNDGELDQAIDRQQSELEKTVWDARGHWKFADGEVPPGLSAFRFKSNVKDLKPIDATARFTDQGLTGEIRNPNPEMSVQDLLLALPAGKFAAFQLDANQFQLDSSNEMTASQFIKSNLLTDKQRWHQSVYQNQFPEGAWERWASSPTLYFWSDPVRLDVQFPTEFRRVGGALFRVPLRIRKTEPGTKVNIPSVFIPVSNVMNRYSAISPSFDNKNGKWMGSISKESTTRLRFKIPRQVLPLEVSSATLTIKSVKALDRTIQFLTVSESPEQLAELDDYAGKFQQQLTDLVLDQDGGFLLDVNMKVKPEFYERQREVEESGDKNSDGTRKRLELTRDELSGIELTVSGTVIEPN